MGRLPGAFSGIEQFWRSVSHPVRSLLFVSSVPFYSPCRFCVKFANLFSHLLLKTIELYQMKIWSSHLLDNLSNYLMNLKNSGDLTGFEPMTSAMPVQWCNWATKSHSWEQVNLLGSCFPVKGMPILRFGGKDKFCIASARLWKCQVLNCFECAFD